MISNNLVLLPIVLGIFSVLQAGINEKILPSLGVTLTVLLNSAVLMTTSVFVWYFARQTMHASPSDLIDTNGGAAFSWWYIIPGIFGYFLVAGLPISIQKIGANSTFLVLVITQLGISLLWECIDEKRTPHRNELISCILAILAMFFAKKEIP